MTPVGRPRAFDAEAVLDDALDLFWRNGYEGTSVSDIAEATGVNKPSLYAAFGDKEALYLQALARYGDQMRERTATILDGEPDARTAVETFLLTVIDTPPGEPSHRPSGCMIVAGTAMCDSATVPDAIKQAVCAALRSSAAALTARLTRARSERQLPASTDVAALASYFSTVLAGLSVQARGQQCRTVLREVVTSAMRAWPADKANAIADAAATAARRRPAAAVSGTSSRARRRSAR